MQPPLHGTLDYEGMVELEVESFDRFTAACTDPYFLNVLKPDEINFLDSKSTEVIGASTMGVSKKIVEGGKAMIDTSKVMSVWEEWERGSRWTKAEWAHVMWKKSDWTTWKSMFFHHKENSPLSKIWLVYIIFKNDVFLASRWFASISLRRRFNHRDHQLSHFALVSQIESQTADNSPSPRYSLLIERNQKISSGSRLD